MSRPDKTEYAEYFESYVSKVPESDIVPAMEKQLAEVHEFFEGITEDKEHYAYADGKWTIREVLGHIVDGERVFAYRALRFSRGDATPLASFEENSYVANSNFRDRRLPDLLEEFSLLRQANLIFFRNLGDEAWQRTGTASDNKITVRGLAYVMVGHVRHHLNVLQTRYLSE